ncbi:PAS domain S-box protein [Methanoregula sp.]|uniref:response regulator n=1 Tax=Methanoregula sp. TaxID=2052170 RepID=UPI00261CF4E3|nr:PAS domain S-box protein [Methanoregula sp.]MDD5143509.1 PAS domain S-box protein [Methanoregula sp.]
MPEQIRVLYVDDEPGLLELGKSFLEKDGDIVVDTAESATLALARLNTTPCDAIVSDYQMPEVNGIEFLKRVRGSGRTIPFILFTGRGREEVVIEAINNGVDFYLQKGGDTMALFAELSHKIRQAVSRYRTQGELQAAYEQLSASEEQLRSQLDLIIEKQEALIKSEEKFRDLVETSLDPIWEMDMNGTFTYMSLACLEVLGYSPEEVRGKTVFSLVAEPVRQAFFHEFATLDRSTKVTRELELPFLCRDGRVKLFEIRSIPQYDAKHQLIGFRGTAHDITERRKAEDRLRKSEEKFRSLVETSPDMIWEVDLEGTVLYASPKVKDIMGYAPELLIGKSVGDFIPEQACPRFARLMQEFTASTGPIAPIEFPGVHRDGHPIFFEIRVARVTGPDGKTIGFRGTGRDITERRKVMDALRESERRCRELAGDGPGEKGEG